MGESRLEKIVEEVIGQVRPAGRGVSNETPLREVTVRMGGVKRIALGSDHGGFPLKEELVRFLQDDGFIVKDMGTFSADPVDYPDFAEKVARAVASGDCERGIMVDSIGVASAMAANKVRGIRAACCWDLTSARSSREHNNANVLTLGGKVMADKLAKEIVSLWLVTPFAGGRHWPRVNKIMAIERKHR
jgi:ribose 5-phosphate isomerase B